VYAGDSLLILPERRPRAQDQELQAFEPPVGSPPEGRHMIEPGHHNWLVHRDLAADESTLEVINDYGVFHIDAIDLTISNRVIERYSSRGDDFTSLRGDVQSTRSLQRGDWRVRTQTRTVLTSTETEFYIQADLDAFADDKRVFCKSWDFHIPRDFV
jgi:hypothetical protein